MLKNIDLRNADPALFETLSTFRAEALPGVPHGGRGEWSAEGPGPVCLTGNTWCNGVLLAPKRLIGGVPRIVAVSYGWDDEKLGEWNHLVEVRMLITDVHSNRSWIANITDERSGALIVPQSTRLSANASVIFQMAAGNRTGRLYSPPYIRRCQVRLHYRS